MFDDPFVYTDIREFVEDVLLDAARVDSAAVLPVSIFGTTDFIVDVIAEFMTKHKGQLANINFRALNDGCGYLVFEDASHAHLQPAIIDEEFDLIRGTIYMGYDFYDALTGSGKQTFDGTEVIGFILEDREEPPSKLFEDAKRLSGEYDDCKDKTGTACKCSDETDDDELDEDTRSGNQIDSVTYSYIRNKSGDLAGFTVSTYSDDPVRLHEFSEGIKTYISENF